MYTIPDLRAQDNKYFRHPTVSGFITNKELCRSGHHWSIRYEPPTKWDRFKNRLLNSFGGTQKLPPQLTHLQCSNCYTKTKVTLMVPKPVYANGAEAPYEGLRQRPTETV